MPAQRSCAAKKPHKTPRMHSKNQNVREGCAKMSFMFTNICKTHEATNFGPNRAIVATINFGDVHGTSVLTRFGDRAKKTRAIFLMVLKKEEEFLMQRYDAKV